MISRAISFTPEVLKAKLRALEEYGRCQTRRPIRSDWIEALGEPELWTPLPGGAFRSLNHLENEMQSFVGPFGVSGQSLWIRERALVVAFNAPEAEVRLRYDDGEYRYVPWPTRLKRPVVGRCVQNGVHREGARHFLEVVEVRAERVSEISETDARLEGASLDDTVPPGFLDRRNLDPATSYRANFFALYDSIYSHGAHARDWCWVYTLKRATP